MLIRPKVFFPVVLFSLSAACLAYISADRQSFLSSHDCGTLLDKVFGEFRGFLSDLSMLEADLYFHGGVYEHDSGDCMTHSGACEPAGRGQAEAAPRDPLSKLALAIRVDEHKHLHGSAEKEILPWLYYSVKLNPHNIRAYTISGYWLGERLNRPDDAVALLRDGLRNNPEAWEIYLAIAGIFVKNKQPAKAFPMIERAKYFAARAGADKQDMHSILSLEAACYEDSGQIDKAVLVYRELLKLSPGSDIFIRKIDSLKAR